MNPRDERNESGMDGASNLEARREEILSCGLAAFDASVASRHRRHRVVRAAVILCCVSTLAVAGTIGIRAMSPEPQHEPRPEPVTIARRPLPPYVTIIESEVQLAAELELANACERVARRGGEIFVVECSHGLR
jgi:hypothetical protein